MYPRQRPSGLSKEEVKQWKKSKVEWYKTNRPVETWPWSVLRLFQQENGISQSGARDLQNQRVNAFLKESFVSVKEIAKNTEIPQFTRFPFNLRFKKHMEEECSILHIHKDVLKNCIIRRLRDDPRSLFSLMLTCKDLQGLCQEMLCIISRERFGPQGTPRALMITTMYNNTTNQKKRKVSQDLKRLCGVTGRDFKVSDNLNTDNTDDIIRVSIKKYGLIDNLEKVCENEAKKEAYFKLERAYILGQIDGRIQQVNDRFLHAGYQGLSVRFDNNSNTCVWTDSRIILVLVAFEYGNEYHASRMIKEVNDWVFMKTDSKVGTPNVDPELFNIILPSIEPNTTSIHPLTHIVLESLMEIKHRDYYLYGRKMSEEDWKTRLSNLFSPLFSKRNPPPVEIVSGAWLCCWMYENTHVKLLRLFETPQFRVSNYYEGMRTFENCYRIRLGLPATGLGYTSHVPMYIVKGFVNISFAHTLLIKEV